MLNSQVMMNLMYQIINNTNANISVCWIRKLFSVKFLLDLDKSLAKQVFFREIFIKYLLTYLLYLNVLCALKAVYNSESSPLYVLAHVKYVLSSLSIQIFI